MIIKLEPWEYEYAYTIGIRRFTENWGKKNSANYDDEKKMEEDRNAQPAAAICELAVAKYLNQSWSGHVWRKEDHNKYKGIPDVGNNIEVRRVRTDKGPAIKLKDLNNGLIVWGARLVDKEYTEVELLGWIDADEGARIGELRNANKPKEKQYKVVPKELLHKDWIKEEIDRLEFGENSTNAS